MARRRIHFPLRWIWRPKSFWRDVCSRNADPVSPQPSFPTIGDTVRSLLSVTDVLTGEVVVSTVHLPHPRSVQVHRDRHAVARIPYPMNAFIVGQDARHPVFLAPRELPDLSQAGMI